MGTGQRDVRDAFIASQNRIISMALIHEKLYQTKHLARIDFASYVRDLVLCIYQSYGKDPKSIRLEIAVEKANLNIDTAYPPAA